MDKKVSIDRHLRYLFPVLDLFIIALLRSLIITGAWFPRIFVCLLGLAVHAYVKLFERFLWKLKWILAKQKHAYLIILNVSGDAQEKHYYDQLMLKSLKLKKKKEIIIKYPCFTIVSWFNSELNSEIGCWLISPTA